MRLKIFSLVLQVGGGTPPKAGVKDDFGEDVWADLGLDAVLLGKEEFYDGL